MERHIPRLGDGDNRGYVVGYVRRRCLPLAGKAGCALRTGRVLDYLDKGDDNRRACSLYLSLMDRMGVHLDRFGDTDKRLENLWSV